MPETRPHHRHRPLRRRLPGAGLAAALVATVAVAALPGTVAGAGDAPDAAEVTTAAIGGAPDPTWATTGVADLPVAERVDAVAEAPDGGIVVTGFDIDDVMVGRFDAGGRLDPTFGTGGRAYADVAGTGRGTTVAVQPDGRVLVGGFENGTNTPILLRFLRNGRLDTSFGDGGVERRVGLQIESIAVRADGLILLAGTDVPVVAPSTVPRVERHLPDGSPDLGFGTDGNVFLPSTGLDGATHVAALADGRTLVGVTRPSTQAFTLIRLTTSGQLDSGFATGGVASTTFSQGPAAIADFTVLGDGSVVAAGTVTVPATPTPQTQVALARYRADGTPEPTFGTGGRVVVPGTASTVAAPTVAIGVRPDGRLVVGTGSIQTTTATILALQLLPNGTPDPLFGTGGIGVSTATRSGFPLDVAAVTVPRDGRVVAAVSDGREVAELTTPFVLRLVTSASNTVKRQGYWMLDQSGRVYAFGDAVYLGDPFPTVSASAGFGIRAVDIAATATGNGYWVVDSIGRVFAFGDAPRFGDVTIPGNPTVSIARTTDGYIGFSGDLSTIAWNASGSTPGSPGFVLNQPVVDAAPAQPTGTYAVAADGGVFALGAPFLGSMGGTPLNQAVTGIAPDPDARGYWLVAADGGIFAFDAVFKGSMGATPLNQPVSDMVPWGDGYLLVAGDGGIFSFGGPFAGSLGNIPPPSPVIAVTALQT